MTVTLKIAAGSALVFAAACALPLGAETGKKDPEASSAAVTCALTVTERGGMVDVAGEVTAGAPVSGSYDLRLRQSGSGGSSDITQGGAFALAAGESRTLGQASFSGRASGLDGTLTVTVDGQGYACPVID